jgi:hypothetical protein
VKLCKWIIFLSSSSAGRAAAALRATTFTATTTFRAATAAAASATGALAAAFTAALAAALRAAAFTSATTTATALIHVISFFIIRSIAKKFISHFDFSPWMIAPNNRSRRLRIGQPRLICSLYARMIRCVSTFAYSDRIESTIEKPRSVCGEIRIIMGYLNPMS